MSKSLWEKQAPSRISKPKKETAKKAPAKKAPAKKAEEDNSVFDLDEEDDDDLF